MPIIFMQYFLQKRRNVTQHSSLIPAKVTSNSSDTSLNTSSVPPDASLPAADTTRESTAAAVQTFSASAHHSFSVQAKSTSNTGPEFPDTASPDTASPDPASPDTASFLPVVRVSAKSATAAGS